MNSNAMEQTKLKGDLNNSNRGHPGRANRQIQFSRKFCKSDEFVKCSSPKSQGVGENDSDQPMTALEFVQNSHKVISHSDLTQNSFRTCPISFRPHAELFQISSRTNSEITQEPLRSCPELIQNSFRS